MAEPYFSIITCTKNSSKFLLKNFDSVEKQTFKNYEQIIIDGKSTDSTKSIISQYKRKSKRFYVFFGYNEGVSNAFNKGVRESKGKYLIFLNSDDYFYDNNVLEDTYNFLIKHNEPDWIYGKINVVEMDGVRIGIFPKYNFFQNSNKELLKFINYIPHQAVFTKKSTFNKYGLFDESLPINMDTDLWLRLASVTRWIFFDRIVSSYTLRKGAITSDKKNIKIAYKTLNLVQKRYLNNFELFFAKIGNRLMENRNRNIR